MLQHEQAEQKYVLSQVLGASQSPRVVAIAMKWADDLGDGDRRANGWLLLRRYQLTPERFRQAIRMLDAEPHAPALEQIIWYVRRAEVPPPSVEALIASKLHRLSRHPNSRVRMASIQTLAEWDRQGRFLMEDLLRLLNDTDPHVRVAAIGASAIYGQLSKPIKRALLRLGTRSDEDPEVRRVALMNLERFSFTQKEFAAYQAAMADVFKASAR